MPLRLPAVQCPQEHARNYRQRTEALDECNYRGAQSEYGLLWIARWPAHYVSFFFFRFKGDRARRVDDEFEKHDVYWKMDKRPIEENGNQRHARDWHVDGKNVGHRLFQVVKDSASDPHGLHDGRKVVVEKDQRCGF